MEEIYEVVGMCWGSFEDKQTGREVKYANLFVKAPFVDAREGSDYSYRGEKCFVMKCEAPDLFATVNPGDMVKLFFNKYGKVSFVVQAE